MADWYLIQRNDLNTGKVSWQTIEVGNSVRVTTGDRVFLIGEDAQGDPTFDELTLDAAPVKAARTENEFVIKDKNGNPMGRVRKVTEQ